MSKHKEPLEKNDQDRTVIINVDLTRGLAVWLVVALAVGAVLGYLTWGGREATAAGEQVSPAATSGMRQFYLDGFPANGAAAASRCAEGYHMASLWEILDPSNLKYNTELGMTRDDSGSGPVAFWGWVRTGYSASTEDTAGRANCNAWTTSDGAAYGTVVDLPREWSPNFADLHIWYSATHTCSSTNATWCVED